MDDWNIRQGSRVNVELRLLRDEFNRALEKMQVRMSDRIITLSERILVLERQLNMLPVQKDEEEDDESA